MGPEMEFALFALVVAAAVTAGTLQRFREHVPSVVFDLYGLGSNG